MNLEDSDESSDEVSSGSPGSCEGPFGFTRVAQGVASTRIFKWGFKGFVAKGYVTQGLHSSSSLGFICRIL